MAASDELQGTFANERMRRREHRWQRTGVLVLCAIVGAALAGQLGDAATVGRAAAVYVFLLAVFRVSGRRTLAQVTTFDLILVLILGDATQDALIGERAGFATAIVAIATLVLVDIGLARAKRRWPTVDVLVDGLPLPLVVDGQLRRSAMASEGVTPDDVLTAARESQGLGRLQEVRFAVLEQNGRISVVPRGPGGDPRPSSGP